MKLSDLEQDLEKYLIKNDYGFNLLVTKGDGVSYKFKCFKWIEELDDVNDYELIFETNSTYDGVRHINFGDEGYLNYPEIPLMANAFILIANYEKERHEDSSSNSYSMNDGLFS